MPGSAGWARGLARVAALALFLAVSLVRAWPAAAADPFERTVLVISSFGKDLPAQAAFERGLDKGLSFRAGKNRVFFEFLDSPRLPLGQSQPALAQMIEGKYQGIHFDAVVAWAEPAAALVSTLRPRFADSALYLAEVPPAAMGRLNLLDATGYGFPADFVASLAEALRLTQATKVVAVGESSPIGATRLQWFRQGMKEVAPRVEIEEWADLPFGQVLERAATLPKDTMLFYLLLFFDENGASQTPFELARRLTEKSSAPVFSPWETLMGSGVVGGHVLSVEVLAENIAAAIARSGHPTGQKPAQRFSYDWRQVDRWGMGDLVQNPDAVILNRQPSVLQQYRWHIAVVASFILALSILSAFLTRALRLRARAMAELAAERAMLADRVRERTEELAASNAELEQFAYAISHDLRQPLRMVSNFVTLLGRQLGDRLDDEARSFVAFAVEGAKRMDRMILSLLKYSRVGHQAQASEWIESKDSLDQVLRFLGPAIAECGAKISVTGTWPRLLVPRDAFERVLLNLIGNAIKYRQKGRTPNIQIRAERHQAGWCIAVADDGIGIKDGGERLFKVFQRLVPADAYEGTGVGLALCRRLVDQMGGNIWMESAGLGRGVTFHFTVPEAQPSAASAA
ncbi:putative Histidine kinase [Magnetospirillum sp. LM-5]|uniref:sensor histidine kinase n=1 Tax=Magnetospirillum sp. LM-5 TaxID=2681466 RepID=UPI001386535D|nr:ATP-binding protein [Magnetospirillum sp. LM-5]CAA7618009.1 putative Histidine kinase [Magnetospirillum sp. LM-5]